MRKVIIAALLAGTLAVPAAAQASFRPPTPTGQALLCRPIHGHFGRHQSSLCLLLNNPLAR